MNRLREAALLVHGLPEAARAAVLQRLTVEERATVLPLLQELQSLGIPALPFDAGAGTSPTTPSLIDRVGALDAGAVARALSTCAPATAAQLWGASTWPWRDAVLAMFDTPRRDAVRRWQDDGAVALAPRMTEALLTRLLADASAASKPGAANTSKRWWSWKR